MQAATWACRGDAVLRVTRAFFLRDLRIALSARSMFLAELLAVVFSVVTTLFLAKIVDPSAVDDYFAFVISGLMVTAFLTAGIMTVSRNLRADQQRGTLEALLGVGIPPARLAAGMTAYPVAYAVPVALIFLIVAFLFGARFPDAAWGSAVAATVLGAVSFAGLGIVGAALVLVLRRGESMLAWLLVLLTFAGGDYFPRDLLPGWLEALGELSPFTQCLELVRAGILEGETGSVSSWMLLALYAVGWWAVGILALTAGLRLARRRGTVSQY